jgi:hypothetical protein
VSRLCTICGNLRELASVPWCALCIGSLHRSVCSKPFGHIDPCDPVPGVLP